MFVKTDCKPELGAYTIKLSSILLHKMPAQHIASTLEMITFRRRNMYKTKIHPLEQFQIRFYSSMERKRSYIRDMITGIILSVIVPVIGSMLSALVVGLLGESLSAVTVIAAILSAFVGYALVNAADTYIRQKHVYHHIEVRSQLFMRQFTKKSVRYHKSSMKTRN